MTSQKVEPKAEERNRLRKDFQVVELVPNQGTLIAPEVGDNKYRNLAGFQTCYGPAIVPPPPPLFE